MDCIFITNEIKIRSFFIVFNRNRIKIWISGLSFFYFKKIFFRNIFFDSTTFREFDFLISTFEITERQLSFKNLIALKLKYYKKDPIFILLREFIKHDLLIFYYG